jgi:deazaflavin-dependent oxidoreductase (nitroreductase family)
MPIPNAVARLNKRVTNRLTRPFAARAPFFAIVEHPGRRSGRIYRTPVNAFRTPDGFAIALTYGREVDWLRNVLAAGSATLEHRGSRITVRDPQVVAMAEARQWIPAPVRLILRVIGVNEAVLVRLEGRFEWSS